MQIWERTSEICGQSEAFHLQNFRRNWIFPKQRFNPFWKEVKPLYILHWTFRISCPFLWTRSQTEPFLPDSLSGWTVSLPAWNGTISCQRNSRRKPTIISMHWSSWCRRDRMSKQSLPVPSSHIPIRVVQVLRFPYGAKFPICPSCGITLEREYQQYCDRCGQCLSWKFFRKAQIAL